jgi:hypothetical protein
MQDLVACSFKTSFFWGWSLFICRREELRGAEKDDCGN